METFDEEDAGSTMWAFRSWAGIPDSDRGRNLQAYITNLAEARYVLRRVLRIVDEHTREHGLEPLAHHVLLQTYGINGGEGIPIHVLAKRLDIAPALASRLVRDLEKDGLVRRAPSAEDKRVTIVSATADGVQRLRDVDSSVHLDIVRFHQRLTEDQREAALSIFAFYVGLDPQSAAERGMKPPRRD